MRNFHPQSVGLNWVGNIGGGGAGYPCVSVQENRGEPPGLHITDTQITEQTNLTTMPTH